MIKKIAGYLAVGLAAYALGRRVERTEIAIMSAQAILDKFVEEKKSEIEDNSDVQEENL